jgi:hypothetical protein
MPMVSQDDAATMFLSRRKTSKMRVIPPNAFDSGRTASRGDLTVAIARAVRYLASSVDSAGRFFYRFDPDTGYVDQSEYNIVRHACTLDGLSAYNDGQAIATIAAAKRFLASHSRRMVGVPRAWAVCDETSRYNLGATALGASAFARSCDSPADEELFEELLASLLFSQRAEGGFTCLYLPGGRPEECRSPHFEGEATYALGVIYELRNRTELEQPLRAALAYLTARELPFSEMLQQHLTVKAMRKAAKAGLWTDATFALECAARMCVYCDRVVETHAYETTAKLATKGEALWALVDIFRTLDRYEQAAECLKRAIWINSLLLQRQFVTGLAVGGFCHSFTKDSVRMDTVSHALACLAEQLAYVQAIEPTESQVS